MRCAYDFSWETCHSWFLLVFYQKEKFEALLEEGLGDYKVGQAAKHVINKVRSCSDPLGDEGGSVRLSVVRHDIFQRLIVVAHVQNANRELKVNLIGRERKRKLLHVVRQGLEISAFDTNIAN